MADVPVHIQLDTDAVVAAVLKTIRLDLDEIRAEVAEGIARAIEVAGGIRCPTCHELPDSSIGSHTYWCANNHMWHGEPFSAAEGAEIARGYTQPAETPGQDS